ncbi:hypothetical protein JCM19235_1281 [Vibrio maritimus]|uniref:Uncharacterized protein n=1 Tax=Vibrio maritimus TaxID=990268 RepID=A0A090S5M4_9VIBR|nr:hypothetical protein JCM19235_1281 [Vibrio maritimus]
MERQLQELLKIRDNLIPELVEAYNVDTREFNALEEEHEKLTQERDELWATVLKQTKIIEQQKAKLDELTQTAETLAKASTSRINGLEAELVTVKSELTDFKRLNPKKLEKTNKEQKARLSTLTPKPPVSKGATQRTP